MGGDELDCRLTNGIIEVFISRTFGPRVLHYGFVGGRNVLGAAPAVQREVASGIWCAYGGHRLWVAPESIELSYAPDNDPVDLEVSGPRAARVSTARDAAGIGKEIDITLDANGSGVELLHRITNHGTVTTRVAPWALTIMAQGGIAIIPQEPFRSHAEDFLPARPMVLWSYSDLSDPRWRLGARFITLQCDSERAAPQKLGVLNKQGWSAYHTASDLFVKEFSFSPSREYPDYNCNNEVFTAGSFIELESLGPVEDLPPGAFTEHRERWMLFADVALGDSEDAIADTITGLLAS
jgi:hypothetical protein